MFSILGVGPPPSPKFSKASLTSVIRFLTYYGTHPFAEHAKKRITEVKEAFENFGDGGGPTPNIENITF